jgi:hypothetical protein
MTVNNYLERLYLSIGCESNGASPGTSVEKLSEGKVMKVSIEFELLIY